MKRGEVWRVDFEPATGSEIQKTRPAVIISRDSANRAMKRVVVVPLTSNTSKVYLAETLVTIRGVRSKAMADQIMTADKSRLKNLIGMLTPDDMANVEDAIRLHLDL